MDSTAGNSRTRSPGADDNGSGTVTHLEAFRVLVESGFKPKNTLEFHWYGGEEGGLLGSADVFSSYRSSGKTVLAMLNQDMTAYSPSGQLAVYTDYVDQALTTYVKAIAQEYTGAAPLTSRCGYGCSDHASARSNGFPAAFVNEDMMQRSNPDIHSPQDVSRNFSSIMTTANTNSCFTSLTKRSSGTRFFAILSLALAFWLKRLTCK
jgi:leucyl aminopeptidase